MCFSFGVSLLKIELRSKKQLPSKFIDILSKQIAQYFLLLCNVFIWAIY